MATRAVKASDYNITLYRVRNNFLVQKDVGVKPYSIEIAKAQAAEEKNRYVQERGGHIKKDKMMRVAGPVNDMSPEFTVYCLAEQVDEAVKVVQEALEQHILSVQQRFRHLEAAAKASKPVISPYGF